VQREFGRIDVLLNNAGTNPYFGTLMDAEEWAWDVTMNVNLKGPFLLSQLAARIMKEQGGGSIINMASAAAFKATILGIYSVTKAGLVMLTQCLAKEWGRYGIRVNALAPGVIETRFSEALWKDPAVGEAATKRNALGFLGVPDDVVGAALFLASDASRYVTGTTIGIDGGELVGAADAP
jgi:dehydrogenase/reductase SDR family member 4